MHTNTRALAGSLAAAALLAPAALRAQVRFEAGTSAEVVTYRMKAAGPIDERSATYYGGQAVLWLNTVRLGLEGLFGNVPGAADQSFDLRATTLQAGVQAGPFQLGGQAEARRIATSRDTSLLRLVGGYVSGSTEFGAGLSGSAGLAYYPFAHALNDDPIDLALRAEVGARYQPRNSRFSFFTSYRVLRIDYKSAGAASPRLTQDAGMMFGINVGTQHN